MKTGKIVAIPQKDSFEEDELPDGWEQVNLSQISELIMGQSPPGTTYNTEGDGVPFFQGKADFTEISPVVRTWCTQPKKFSKSGDILISVRAPVGPTNVADRDCSIGRGLAAIRPKNGIPTEYILYYLKLKEPELALSGTGSTFTAIKKEDLANLSIPLAPLTEQQRIVARVEALLTHVNAARDWLSRVPLIMNKFRQAVLAAACSGRLTEGWRESNVVEGIEQSLQKDNVDFNDETNTLFYIGSVPETWGWISIDDAMEKVIDYRGRTPPIEKEGIPHITTSNIRNGHINWITEKFVTQETYDNYMTRGIPEIGDVFFTMEGPLGEVAILHENRKFSLAQRMLLLRGQKEIFDSEYLAFALMCSGVQSAINMKATGSGVKGIAYKRFKHVQLPLPPLAEQHEIVRRVGLLFERADAFDQEVAAAGRRCERLTQAVLGKAFSGKL
jgi:type I restriction enzyme S subunit